MRVKGPMMSCVGLPVCAEDRCKAHNVQTSRPLGDRAECCAALDKHFARP